MLTRTPDMVEWGLMEDVDPADYFGKTIEVERFKAIGSLAIQGEIIAWAFLTDGSRSAGPKGLWLSTGMACSRSPVASRCRV
ncbi:MULTISPECIES: hypothetical protein [Paenibacillus]|uniref:Uncharacterized protein n=2 Tax=Paenibacillus polymyxa TaxID=1406 RepID=A0AAE9IH87_PAEPO|nr:MULTISPECIES: hypothetical protein [Paenibacillus]KAF6581912.1 hypothetical protein G9G54_03220 [Paenibacillus sp. EKM212P]MCP3794699.1 hypothetical protein [Paenibacillus sp. CH40]MDY7994230.1 hypothetical protein [Paenibacillus polymyxa]MDY8120919.1 hypothetical protein [Paenibacillus polymyxa]URJ52713.1 hypothetical protein MF626_002250 [Paenibacillus polymyxa]